MEGEIWVLGVEIWGVWLLEGGRADSRSVPQTDLGHVKQSRRQAPGDQQQQRALQPRHGVGGAPGAPRRPGECPEPHGTAGGGVETGCRGSPRVLSASSPPLQASRPSRKGIAFGKRSNSMKRNPNAAVTKSGWLYKQVPSCP